MRKIDADHPRIGEVAAIEIGVTEVSVVRLHQDRTLQGSHNEIGLAGPSWRSSRLRSNPPSCAWQLISGHEFKPVNESPGTSNRTVPVTLCRICTIFTPPLVWELTQQAAIRGERLGQQTSQQRSRDLLVPAVSLLQSRLA